jgi:hypothetical protein
MSIGWCNLRNRGKQEEEGGGGDRTLLKVEELSWLSRLKASGMSKLGSLAG